ncbi:MAG: CAP domain-containing protein [Candidatus Margulisbacteria bacterium]|nr:CAP domain-containing protein [Candidatus Margulisiibacteriota bacterium]
MQINVFASSTISFFSQEKLPFQPNQLEMNFFQQLQDYAKQHSFSLNLDPHLSIAAIIYSKEIAQNKTAMSAGLLEYSLFEAGCPEANVFPYILRFSQEKQFGKFIPEILNTFILQNANHCGLGFSFDEKDNSYVLVILGAKKHVVLEPFPKTFTQIKRADLKGSLLHNYKNLSVVITSPKDKIIILAPEIKNDNFVATITFDQSPGKYRVELIGEEALGPEVLSLFSVYVNTTPPLIPVKKIYKDKKNYNSAFEAEKLIFDLVNTARIKAKLNPLILSPQASDAARYHSEDMVAQKYFAHISPYNGQEFTQRLQENTDFAVTSIGENIAMDETLNNAHQSLMNSPAHRANILNPDFTHLGVGVAFKTDHKGKVIYYLTEGFFSKIKDIKSEEYLNFILENINKQRQELGLDPFIINLALSELAEKHSLMMAEEDNLSFSIGGQHLFQKVQKAGIKYKYLSVNIFAFNDPSYKKYLFSPELEQGKFKEIGIGIYQKDSKKFGRKAIWLTLIFIE